MLHKLIAKADTTGLHADADLALGGRRNFALVDFKIGVWFGEHGDFHFRHWGRSISSRELDAEWLGQVRKERRDGHRGTEPTEKSKSEEGIENERDGARKRGRDLGHLRQSLRRYGERENSKRNEDDGEVRIERVYQLRCTDEAEKSRGDS
jgi:hypothetical protein